MSSKIGVIESLLNKVIILNPPTVVSGRAGDVRFEQLPWFQPSLHCCSLTTQVDKFVIGGGMVFTFLKARGLSVGSSLVEDEHVSLSEGYIDVLSSKHFLLTPTIMWACLPCHATWFCAYNSLILPRNLRRWLQIR